ncbi:MAG: cadherin repeat domain-containing protein, partial [Erythrobacter sp.]|nr:cadherin repeat domain-containing protein [Erythrobacter sp.]
MNFERTALLVAMALALTSCGGGNGGSGTGSTPPTANQAPQFNSASAVSVLENSSGPFYKATATDSDGDAVSFSIVGGADASLFRLDGADLSFTSTPNFDRFADADR